MGNMYKKKYVKLVSAIGTSTNSNSDSTNPSSLKHSNLNGQIADPHTLQCVCNSVKNNLR